MTDEATERWNKVRRTVIARRLLLGMSQKEAATKAGVSLTTWNNLETGDEPRFRGLTLVGVCRALGYKPNAIDRWLDGEDGFDPIEGHPDYEGGEVRDDLDDPDPGVRFRFWVNRMESMAETGRDLVREQEELGNVDRTKLVREVLNSVVATLAIVKGGSDSMDDEEELVAAAGDDFTDLPLKDQQRVRELIREARRKYRESH